MKTTFRRAATLGLALSLLTALPATAQNTPGDAHAGHGSPASEGSPATAAYQSAMETMHNSMDGLEHPDPDVAFVLGMIPHHQAAIDMAKVQLRYGKDPENRKLAEDIIAAQTREIAEMHSWLAKRGVTIPK